MGAIMNMCTCPAIGTSGACRVHAGCLTDAGLSGFEEMFAPRRAYRATEKRGGVWIVTEDGLPMVEVGVGDISERQAKQIAAALNATAIEEAYRAGYNKA
jgi:chloramphenicol 3-O-phosphotransferase